MTTRRLRVLCTAIVPWVATASLLAAPIGRPTPPPCTADGACVPARGTWGYHNTQWRTWPGTHADDRKLGESSAIGNEYVPSTAKPDPRIEDKVAPPKVEALEEQPAEPSREGEADDLPALEAPRPGDGAAGEAAREPDFLTPPRPGFMDRAPGALPFDGPADGAAPDAEPAGRPALPFGQPPAAPRPPANLFPSNTQATPRSPALGEDAPPPLPFAIQPQRKQPTRRASNPGFVLPASASSDSTSRQATASRIPVSASPQRVQRAEALSHFGDAPPHIPQGLFGSR